MSVIATALKHLIAAGVSGDDLVRAVAEMEAAQPAKVDPVAEKRRAYDRERKRNAKRNSTGIPPESAESTESAETPSLSRPPNENNSNPPTHTHPECVSPRARKADPFPKPDWAETQVWADLKANRKAKRLPNTPTAYTKFIRDIDQWIGDEWPPGRVLEAIVARGWASAQYDPREAQHGTPPRNLPQSSGSRGERRNPCLDMLYQAEAEIRAERNPDADRPPWPPLRTIGEGGP